MTALRLSPGVGATGIDVPAEANIGKALLPPPPGGSSFDGGILLLWGIAHEQQERLSYISPERSGYQCLSILFSILRVLRIIVIPAQAGIHNLLIYMDPGFRRGDEKRIIRGSLMFYVLWRSLIHSFVCSSSDSNFTSGKQ